ncbi:MAG: mechanosensitive ion channel family protein [Rhodospirillales bacterium]|nr:MAG: mechanosensitive ion channel family protein [Rhodospirillales bacterium]
MDNATLAVWQHGLITAGVLILVAGAALVLHRIAFAVGERISRRTPGNIDSGVIHYGYQPAQVIFVTLGLIIVMPTLPLPEDVRIGLQRLLVLVQTAAIGWLAVRLTNIINDTVAARYDLQAADNLVAREVHTRVRMLQRILVVVIVVITACLILMAIPSIRQIGVTLFASAGVAGLVIGFAARPALSNLIAGVQLALTQPIRIDDVVIVEGEWGWIEEIRSTFVVVRVWDLRRLVVPLSHFIEQPFQNWTRRTADILGTVFLYVDYTVPVDAVRQELHRLVQDNPLWDGQVWGLQVTNATERTVELRALVGARTSGDAWNLRCQLREQLIEFLQRQYPDSLPKMRAELPEKLSQAASAAAKPARSRRRPTAAGPDATQSGEGAHDDTLRGPEPPAREKPD